MIQLISIVIALPLLAFYIWMVRDMANNDALPAGAGLALRWPPVSKSEWVGAFIFLNLLAAGYYYFTEYRKSH